VASVENDWITLVSLFSSLLRLGYFGEMMSELYRMSSNNATAVLAIASLLENRTGSEIFSALFRHDSADSYSCISNASWSNKIGSILNLCRRSEDERTFAAMDTTIRKSFTLSPWRYFFKRFMITSHRWAVVLSGSLPFTGGGLRWLGCDLSRRRTYLKSIRYHFPIAFFFGANQVFAILDLKEQILWL